MFIQGREADHTIQSPLTCRIQVKNNSTFSAGQAVFQIYNLAKDVRSDIYKDAYESRIYKQVQFAAGYQLDTVKAGTIQLPIIYQGNVYQASSYRQGPDWITEIQALDGGFAMDNASINLTKPSPYNFRDVMNDIVNRLKPFHLKLGLIGAFDFPNSRGITFSGNPWDLIIKAVAPLSGQAYINKEVVNILQQWEYVQDAGLLDTLSDENGMIGTPRLQEALVRARLIFEPRLEVGQKIELQTLESRMNGDYKVLSVVHTGTISGAVCEALETEVTLFQPERDLVAA